MFYRKVEQQKIHKGSEKMAHRFQAIVTSKKNMLRQSMRMKRMYITPCDCDVQIKNEHS